MDSLHSQILKTPKFFSTISPSRPIFSFPNRFKRNPFKTHGFHTGLLPKTPLLNPSPFTISARLGRASKRRNSLRKKLNDEKVHKSDFFDLDSNFQSTSSSSLEEITSSTSVEKTKQFGESVLWSKLENWVDQYKTDIEFWGLGSGPVFTIYKNLDGKIESVSVNEDEILIRSQNEPSLFKKEEMGQNFIEEVKLKISHANRLAREIETGEYELPKNSTIAKIVVAGQESGFGKVVSAVRPAMLSKLPQIGQQSGFRNAVSAVHPAVLSNLPQIGLVMFCGWLVLWTMKKVFMVGDDGEELSREEKEMLRRKMISRREKEKLEIDGVEVLPDVGKSLMGSIKRPQVNREEIMNSISRAKATGERLTLPDSSSSVDAKSGDISRKIQEIKEMARQAWELEKKEMARQARELEKKDRHRHEGVNEESSSLLDSSSSLDVKSTDISRKIQETTETAKQVLELAPKDGEKHDRVKKESSIEIEDVEMNMELGVHSLGNTSGGDTTKSMVDDSNMIDSGSMLEGASTDASTKTSSRIWELKEIAGQRRENVNEDSSNEMEDADIHGELGVSNLNDISDGDTVKSMGISATSKPPTSDDPTKVDTGSLLEGVHVDVSENKDSRTSDFSIIEGTICMSKEDSNRSGNSNSSFLGRKADNQSFDAPSDESYYSNKSISNIKPQIIRSVEEAREYLSQKRKRKGRKEESKLTSLKESEDVLGPIADENKNVKSSQMLNKEKEVHESSMCDETSKTKSVMNTCKNSSHKGMDLYMQEEIQSVDAPSIEFYNSNISSNELKPRVMRSVKEAREYLSQNHEHEELGEEPNLKSLENYDILDPVADEKGNDKGSQMKDKEKNGLASSIRNETLKTKYISTGCEKSTPKKMGLDDDVSQAIPFKITNPKDMGDKYEMGDLQMPRNCKENTDIDSEEAVPPISTESWIEKNFQEFEPIVKKIGDGFRENYMLAKEKSEEQLNFSSELNQFVPDEDNSELEWMKDDSLREIVFQVRENELMGRDPFHMIDAKDKSAFFEGLKKKVEKENAKLLNLHEWVHSRIENLDYGADGISLYDLPEKVIPRWKGPPVDNTPEFLNNRMKQQEEIFAENGVSVPVEDDAQDTCKTSSHRPSRDDNSTASVVHSSKKIPQNGALKSPKTVIESSDGSSRVGKKSGKEYWQHTKKWSREFLEAYNAETDPEVKAIMKDMGKDLDRWITGKEVGEVGDLMNNIPKRRRRSIQKKLDKLKREMAMFGPQAVVSKYCEYADDKEEDYLWWLDLSFVLCIELYTAEDGVQQVGFYSLEMAADLELDPKQYHVIAFEDRGDSKSFCHIIQAHMEVHGNGRAFVVAQPPKDVYREAKANSFSVTVIRKGELRLNVDLTLEEVEEQMTDIGSKMYHDKIMRERSMDIGSLMKGVFGGSKSSKRRRSKRMLKKPIDQ